MLDNLLDGRAKLLPPFGPSHRSGAVPAMRAARPTLPAAGRARPQHRFEVRHGDVWRIAIPACLAFVNEWIAYHTMLLVRAGIDAIWIEREKALLFPSPPDPAA